MVNLLAQKHPSSPIRASLVGTGLAVLAILVLLVLYFGVQWAVQQWSEDQTEMGYSSSQQIIARRLPGQTLHLPQNFIREAEHRQDGFGHRLELAMTWPDLAGFGDAQRASFAGIKGAKPLILLSIQPIAQQPHGAALLNTVYVHEFYGDTLYGPAGLVGKKLRAPGPFAHEIVWYDPLPKDPFVAKCDDVAPTIDQTGQRLEATCTRSLQITGALSVSYRFPANLLDQRRALDKAITQRILGFVPTKQNDEL